MNSVFAFVVLLGISGAVKAGPNNMILASEVGPKVTTDERTETFASMSASKLREGDLFVFPKPQNDNDSRAFVFEKNGAGRFTEDIGESCVAELMDTNSNSDKIRLESALTWKLERKTATAEKNSFDLYSKESDKRMRVSCYYDLLKKENQPLDFDIGKMMSQKGVKIARKTTTRIERMNSDSVDPNLLIQPAVLEKKEVLDGHWGEGAPPRPRPGQVTGTR